jgi:hypothetical protein
VRGGGQPESLAYTPVPLIINDELWEALSASPLPYQILEVADKTLPDAFKSGCYGVRVAKIEDMLDEARGRGLKETEDLTVYVLSLLNKPSLSRDRHWRAAVKLAADGQAPLTAYYSD